MKISKNALGILMLSLVFVLSACGNNNSTKESTHDNHSDSSTHEEMDHSGAADVPEGLQESKNPKYKVGSQVIINTSHMKGMKGATAEIDSAEKTTVYMVDYTSTTSGEKVKNHKWVTEDEL